MMTTKLSIDCMIQDKPCSSKINDLVDLDKFIATHQAIEYFFFHPDYTASFKLCTKFIDTCFPEFVVGCGDNSREYEIKTLQTLLYCLGDNVDVKDVPLFFQTGNSLFEVTVKGLTPNW